MNPRNIKKVWARPEATPLTDTGSRSDNPDVAARNAAGGPSAEV